MTDIVKRLRSFDVFNAPMNINGIMVSPLSLMAADEIVRLREERDTARAQAANADAQCERDAERAKRLRNALLQIASSGVDGESLNLSRVGHAGCINVAKDALKEDDQ